MSAQILIVEDEPELLGLFQTIVKRRNPGLDVRTAQGGQAAITFLQENIPDVITLDLAMPFVSGNDVIHYIVSDARLVHTIVIVVTAVPSRLDGDSRERVSAVLTKPVSPAELERLIASYLSPDR